MCIRDSPKIFELDSATGRPTRVAGVPPDYFSPLGQLWGNPLFDWETLRADHYAWWIERFRANFGLYDVIRLEDVYKRQALSRATKMGMSPMMPMPLLAAWSRRLCHWV